MATDPKKNLRDHGYPEAEDLVQKVGVPFARAMDQADPKRPAAWPNCKCEQIMFIEVPVFGGMIRGGEGTGR